MRILLHTFGKSILIYWIYETNAIKSVHYLTGLDTHFSPNSRISQKESYWRYNKFFFSLHSAVHVWTIFAILKSFISELRKITQYSATMFHPINSDDNTVENFAFPGSPMCNCFFHSIVNDVPYTFCSIISRVIRN